MDNVVKMARIHFFLGIFKLIIFSFVLFLSLGSPMDSMNVTLLVIIFGLAIANFLASHGLKQNREWARLISNLISLVLLVGFPIGTIIGIYLLFITPSPGAMNT